MFNMKHLIYIIIIVLLLLIIFNNNKKPSITEVITRDTIEIEKPIVIEKLVPETVYITKYITDTLYMKDSTKVEVEIPISTYEYNDSLHNIVYEGYKAQISHFECKGKETYIYKTKTLEIEKKRPLIEFKPSVGIGYGLKHQKIDVYVGGSMVINF